MKNKPSFIKTLIQVNVRHIRYWFNRLEPEDYAAETDEIDYLHRVLEAQITRIEGLEEQLERLEQRVKEYEAPPL